MAESSTSSFEDDTSDEENDQLALIHRPSSTDQTIGQSDNAENTPPAHEPQNSAEDDGGIIIVSDWAKSNRAALEKLRRDAVKKKKYVKLSKLRLGNFYRNVDLDYAAEIQQKMINGGWNFTATTFSVCLNPDKKTYEIIDGGHRFVALTGLNTENRGRQIQRVRCYVYENVTDDLRFALTSVFGNDQIQLPMRFPDEIDLIRKFNSQKMMTVDMMPWKCEEALPLYEDLLGQRQSHGYTRLLVRLSFLPEAHWNIVKEYIFAFQAKKVEFVPTPSHPDLNCHDKHFLDLTSAEFWKIFLKSYEKNDVQTIFAFAQVEGSYMSYDALNNHLRRNISAFLGKLQNFDLHFPSLDEACKTLIGGRSFTDQQLMTALKCRSKFQRVGMNKSNTSIESVKEKLNWYFDTYYKYGQWKGERITDVNFLDKLRQCSVACIDLQWVKDHVSYVEMMNELRTCKMVMFLSHDSNQFPIDFEENGLFTTPTLFTNVVVKPRPQLFINHKMRNALAVWIYVFNDAKCCSLNEIHQIFVKNSLASIMTPEEFGGVLHSLFLWLKSENPDLTLVVAPPLTLMPEFTLMMASCFLPADFVYLDDNHRQLIESSRQSNSLIGTDNVNIDQSLDLDAEQSQL